MADKTVWDREIPVPVKVIQYIDDGVKEKLPGGTVFGEIYPSGASYWARTAKIEATDKNGDDSPFFIKVHQKDHGRDMVSAEFQAMSELYSVMPEIVAEPLAWGAYKDEPDTWFYICRFRELSEDIPDVSDFPALLAEMHKRGVSKTGEFGFPVTTFGGRNPRTFPVSKSWEETFSKGLSNTFDIEEESQGKTPEMTELRNGIMTKVVPRLLRPLETEGRKLTPTLVHGDIWDGNASVDVQTGTPLIFDATPMYAHNEYDLAPWWAPRHKMTGSYIAEYIKHYPVSEPTEDFRERGLLYMLNFDLLSSSLYPGNPRHRNLAMNTMRHLLDAFPLGYEGYQKEKVANAHLPNTDPEGQKAAETGGE